MKSSLTAPGCECLSLDDVHFSSRSRSWRRMAAWWRNSATPHGVRAKLGMAPQTPISPIQVKWLQNTPCAN